MHEVSVMSGIVESVLKELEKHDVLRVEEVLLTLGELTFLGEEQLQFAYEIITRDTLLGRFQAGDRAGGDRAALPVLRLSGKGRQARRGISHVHALPGLPQMSGQGKGPQGTIMPGHVDEGGAGMKDLRYRDEATATKIMEKLKAMDLDLRFMHVCGTHQDTLVKFGLEKMLTEVGRHHRPRSWLPRLRDHHQGGRGGHHPGQGRPDHHRLRRHDGRAHPHRFVGGRQGRRGGRARGIFGGGRPAHEP